MRFLAPALLILTAAPLAAQTPAPPAAPAAATPAPIKLTAAQEADFLALGKKYTRWFFAGRFDSLAPAVDPEMLTRIDGPAGLNTMLEQITERAGFPTKVLLEKMTYRNGMPQFWYEAEFSEFAIEPVVVRWILNAEGKIVGSGVNPKSKAPPVDGI